MPIPSFQAVYLAFPLVLGVHNLDECTHAERRLANPPLQPHRSFYRSDLARFAMILLTVASCVVALLSYATHAKDMVIIAELSVFALFFNAVGHVLLSMKHRTWRPGTRSAMLLVLPYCMAAFAIMMRGTGGPVLGFWPLALGGLIALPAAVLIALALAKGASRLTSRH